MLSVLQLATEGHFGKERVNAPPGHHNLSYPSLGNISRNTMDGIG
jgi:hypothetical protein